MVVRQVKLSWTISIDFSILQRLIYNTIIRQQATVFFDKLHDDYSETTLNRILPIDYKRISEFKSFYMILPRKTRNKTIDKDFD